MLLTNLDGLSLMPPKKKKKKAAQRTKFYFYFFLLAALGFGRCSTTSATSPAPSFNSSYPNKTIALSQAPVAHVYNPAT
jgi:hypothetical protein